MTTFNLKRGILIRLKKRHLLIAALFVIASTAFLYFQTDKINQLSQNSNDKKEVQKIGDVEIQNRQLLIKFKPQTAAALRTKANNNKTLQAENVQNEIRELSKKVKIKDLRPISKKPSSRVQTASQNQSKKELEKWFVINLDEDLVPLISTPKLKSSQEASDHKLGIKGESEEEKKLKKLLDEIRSDPTIEAAEPNYVFHTTATPNDPYYSSSGTWSQSYDDLWGIKKINGASAWDIASGSASVVIADIDTGVDYNHADLSANMWTNSGESGGGKETNGVDDDSNGYIDDFRGWDFYNNDNNPMDDHGHGTHTAGTIAAVGNNSTGVTGVMWTAKIMPIKWIGSNGQGDLTDAVDALEYAADNGAKVSSNSYGCNCQSSALDDAVNYAHSAGMTVVVAAGNSNLDALDFSPASSERAITVGATDSTDAKASFSNYGAKIDVFAPGVDILSTKSSSDTLCANTTVGTYYCRLQGTSMATPHVAGLAGLLLSKDSTLTPEEIRQRIRIGAADIGTTGRDTTFGYGRINANNALQFTTKPLSPLLTAPRSRAVIYGTSYAFTGKVPGPNFSSFKIQYNDIEYGSTDRDITYWIQLTTSTTQPTTETTLATINTTQIPDGKHIFRLTGTDQSSNTYLFETYDVEVDNFDAAITNPSLYVSKGTIAITGSANTKHGLGFSSYSIAWASGETTAPPAYSTTGITLANSGTQSVSNGELGTWDTSGLSAGTYTLRLTVTASNSSTNIIYHVVTVDDQLIGGWPKQFSPPSVIPLRETVGAFADIDGDGQKEIIIGGYDNKLYAYNKNGSLVSGFPFSGQSDEKFAVPITTADINNDGKEEIIAVAYQTSSELGKIYVITYTGSTLSGWTSPQLTYYYPNSETPIAIADINNDGSVEILAADQNSNMDLILHAFKPDGTELSGFPKNISSNLPFYFDAITVSDLDNDNQVEIIISSFTKLFVLDNTGTILSNWPFTPPAIGGYTAYVQRATTGDINGDGKLEIFVRVEPSTLDAGYTRIYAFNKDGSQISNFPQSGDSNVWYFGLINNHVSLVDLDNDGKDEVVASSGNLNIFDASGKKTIQTTGLFTAPSIVDLNGDNVPEVVGGWHNFPTSPALYYLKAIKSDGTVYWSKEFPNQNFTNPVVASDIDNNGKIEILALDVYNATYYLWEIPNNGNTTYGNWPMFGKDPMKTSRIIPRRSRVEDTFKIFNKYKF